MSAPVTLETAPARARAVAALAVALVAEIEQDALDLSATEISAKVNGVLADADLVLRAISDYQAEEVYDLGRSLSDMMAALERFAAAVIEERPPIVDATVQVATPLLVWVHERYGTSDRVDEILRLNSLPDPLMVPAGTVLKVYAY